MKLASINYTKAVRCSKHRSQSWILEDKDGNVIGTPFPTRRLAILAWQG